VQRRSRSVFGGPLRAAPPARVFLAGHRCVAGTAQAWEVAVAHDVRSCLGETALPSLGTKLSVRSPCGVRPAVLCAKSLRRSGEVALDVDSTRSSRAAHGRTLA